MSKNIVLSDCSIDEIRDLVNALDANAEKIHWEYLYAISNWGRTNKLVNLTRYFTYFYFPFKIFLRRAQFERIIGWQQFYVLCFCFFCNVFRVKKKQKTIIALNFTYKAKKGLTGRIYRRFMKTVLSGPYIDFIHVLSREYANEIHNEFDFPLEKIAVGTFGVRDRYPQFRNSAVPADFDLKGEYALAIGRSNRDYKFLIDSWKNIDLPLVIISDSLDYDKNSLPANVRVIDNVSGDLQYPFIINCRLMILPIQDGSIPSGDTVLLTAMSFCRNVIITSPSTLAEMYIRDGENGFVIEKNADSLSRAVSSILGGKDLGPAARKSYTELFSLEAMGHSINKIIGLSQDSDR